MKDHACIISLKPTSPLEMNTNENEINSRTQNVKEQNHKRHQEIMEFK